MEIEVKKPSREDLNNLGVRSWPIWEKEVSAFDWFYDEKETCLFLEGDVEIELADNSKVKIIKGDLVVFPKGLKCRWNIKKKVKKHYKFGD
ncbi:MAG: cupin domain-containing protein [Candidatus Omnitrophica bacterium]|nr:cupin domain-containing protein [Candidatus Omnitrophota bacterium]